MRLPFSGDSYNDDSKPFSAQRAVNCRVEPGPPSGSRTEAKCRSVFGIDSFTTAGGVGPIRGLKKHKGDGRLYAVSADKFYFVSSTGTTTELGALTTGLGRVIMVDGGQTSTDNQLLILDGTNAYVWNQVSSTFTTIPIATLPSAITGDYLDGYYIVNQSESSDTFEISALNDATSWAAEQTRESSEADPIKRVFSNHGELWVFGASVTKVWTNTGNLDFPFEPLDGTLMDRGLLSKFAVVAEDNSIFWLGDDRIVYRAAGYTPQRVSTFAIEQQLAKCDSAALDISWMSSYTEGGSKIISLVVPGTACAFEYNTATGLWNERATFGRSDWGVSDIEEAYGKIFVGSSYDSKIGVMSSTSFTEFSGKMQYTRVTQSLNADQTPFILDRLELIFESGIGELSGEGADPEVMLYISRNGGVTYGNPLTRKLGARGAYDHRAVWRRLGQHYNTTFKFVVTDPVRRNLMGIVGEAEPLDI